MLLRLLCFVVLLSSFYLVINFSSLTAVICRCLASGAVSDLTFRSLFVFLADLVNGERKYISARVSAFANYALQLVCYSY